MLLSSTEEQMVVLENTDLPTFGVGVGAGSTKVVSGNPQHPPAP